MDEQLLEQTDRNRPKIVQNLKFKSRSVVERKLAENKMNNKKNSLHIVFKNEK